MWAQVWVLESLVADVALEEFVQALLEEEEEETTMIQCYWYIL